MRAAAQYAWPARALSIVPYGSVMPVFAPDFSRMAPCHSRRGQIREPWILDAVAAIAGDDVGHARFQAPIHAALDHAAIAEGLHGAPGRVVLSVAGAHAGQ